MMSSSSLQQGLLLMQLADSSFPSGGFTQSFGLETFIQCNDIKTKDDLARFMETYLYYTWRPTDLLAVKLAWEATQAADGNKLVSLDKRLHAMKLSYESREGSLKMGRQLKQLLSRIDEQYSGEVTFPFGHHAIILGHYGGKTNIAIPSLLMAFAHMTAVSLVANGVRAIPLGQTSGQQVLVGLHSLLESCINWAKNATITDWGGSAPAFDWAGMAHERLYSRIFMS